MNNAIEPISNLDHWGTTLDHWDYPVDGKGDCKIYALFKRKLLIDRGFPRQALLMTIVRDLNGEGHAVLTVKTDRGDFVLDNLSDEIRAMERHRLSVLQAPGPGRPERLAQPRRRDRVRAGNGCVELERWLFNRRRARSMSGVNPYTRIYDRRPGAVEALPNATKAPCRRPEMFAKKNRQFLVKPGGA